jgi:hypothetical protein
MKTAYPELPLIKNPDITTVGLEDSVHILLSQAEDECLARAVFGVMWAEASRTSDKKSFRSAGNYNYSGVQTDGNRWAYSDPIVNRFWKTDVGGNYREFAGFKNNEGFFDFMLNRIKAKKFNGCNADDWTNTYIQSWWSPKAKAQYTKGSQKYNDKKAIFNTAMKRFDEFKQTFKGKKKPSKKSSGGFKVNLFLVSFFLTFGGYFVYKNRNLLRK